VRDELGAHTHRGWSAIRLRAAGRYWDAGGLFCRDVAAMKGVEQPPQYHPEGDVWNHTLLMLQQLNHPRPALAMGVLLHDVGKPPTFRVADRIRFNGHVEEGVRMAHADFAPVAVLAGRYWSSVEALVIEPHEV